MSRTATASRGCLPEPSPARQVAVEAVVRTTRDGLPLALPLACERLASRDRALAFEIACGTIRFLSRLDALLVACMARPLPRKRYLLWAVLRTALYQIYHTRVPARAAVHEAVAMVKRSPDHAHAGFVNAVLRRAAAMDISQILAGIPSLPARLALETAHPEWLVRRWLDRVGLEVTQARLAAGNQPAPLTLRANTLLTSRQQLLESLPATASPFAPHALLLPTGGSVEALPGYREGHFAVQDQAAQLVAHLVAPRPGDRILDACAAPGGKTAHLAALAGGKASIIALEKRTVRLARLQENIHRLQVSGVEIKAGDATDPALFPPDSFDRILVDAPCTGTGVIRRHPDIKWRRAPQSFAKSAILQAQILKTAALWLRPGGILVYATCSLEPEENQDQLSRFLAENPTRRRQPVSATTDPIPPETITPQGDFFSEPGQAGMDGFYAARLQ